VGVAVTFKLNRVYEKSAERACTMDVNIRKEKNKQRTFGNANVVPHNEWRKKKVTLHQNEADNFLIPDHK
jgi:hypothetical protein